MAKRTRKTKLQKLLTSKEEHLYETTFEDCEEWFRVLNRELFNNKLPDIDYVDIRWRRKAYAYYEYIGDTKDKDFQLTVLNMNKKYKSKKFFVEVLAHEMVHHYQFVFDEPIGHGKSFERWADTFNKKGLKLYKVYGDEK